MSLEAYAERNVRRGSSPCYTPCKPGTHYYYYYYYYYYFIIDQMS